MNASASVLSILGAFGLLLFPAARAHAQNPGPWVAQFDVGSASIHRFVSDRDSLVVGASLARGWANDHVRIGGSMWGSTADLGFVLADVNAEFRFCGTGCRVAPFVGVGAGPLVEMLYGHSKSRRAGGGVEIRLSSTQLVRFSAYKGAHSGDARGPHLFTIAFVRRFGRSG